VKMPARVQIPARSISTFVILIGALLLCGAPVSAQTSSPADLDTYVVASMKAFDVPGLSVAIVKNGSVVLTKGYGVGTRVELSAPRVPAQLSDIEVEQVWYPSKEGWW